MRLGAYINARPPGGVGALASASELADRAGLLEEVGYASLWTGDQIFRGTEPDDPLATLLVAASATEDVELGTCILQVPLRNPVELAVRVQALANLSGHRFLLGVGAGSTESDFLALGADFERRFTTLDEHLAVMATLWSGGAYQGGAMPLVEGAPKGVKVLVGTWGSAYWLRRAAQDFDGWIASARTPRPGVPAVSHPPSSWTELEEGIARFRDLGGGRAVCANIRARLLGEEAPDNGLPNLVGTPKVVSARLERLAGLGFDDAVLHLDSWDEAEMRAIRQLWPD